MTAEPVAVRAETPVDVALTLMTEYGVHQLPVVEDERPIGLVGLRQAARRARSRARIGLGFRVAARGHAQKLGAGDAR